MAAGVKTDGSYPENTINHRVEDRLKGFAEGLKKFAESDSDGKKKQEDK
jgi:hypothetical protein